MHPERVVVARVSAIVAVVVAITIVVAAAVGAFESLLLGHLFPNVQIIIISSVAAHELRLRSSE
jgi:hypothetical protein